MKKITRQNVMNDFSVHTLTKEILKMTLDKNAIERYYDVALVLEVLRGERDAVDPVDAVDFYLQQEGKK